MIVYKVEHRCSSDTRWGVDAEFESLDEAIEFLEREALAELSFTHRLVSVEASEVSELMHVNALKNNWA